jgi:hypothetical protein
MAKGQDAKKSSKKQPSKSLKEKRNAKKEKRAPASNAEA